jgi:hypothetical protein
MSKVTNIFKSILTKSVEEQEYSYEYIMDRFHYNMSQYYATYDSQWLKGALVWQKLANKNKEKEA